MIEEWDFLPRRTPENCVGRSCRTPDYNCLAFAAGETTRWWEPYVIPPEQPGVFWPENVNPDNGVDDWVAALKTVGFNECTDGSLEPGSVKVAILGRGDTAEHATRQLASGKWVSKLGELEDIEHDRPETVGGGDYGEVLRYLSRPRVESDP